MWLSISLLFKFYNLLFCFVKLETECLNIVLKKKYIINHIYIFIYYNSVVYCVLIIFLVLRSSVLNTQRCKPKTIQIEGVKKFRLH